MRQSGRKKEREREREDKICVRERERLHLQGSATNCIIFQELGEYKRWIERMERERKLGREREWGRGKVLERS